jgi:hypothetical protein
LAQWPEPQRLRVYTEVLRWLERMDAKAAASLPQHWLLEWAIERTNANHGSESAWLQRIKPAQTALDGTASVRFAVLKALRRNRCKPSQEFLQSSWRTALDLAVGSSEGIDTAVLAVAITQNGDIPRPAEGDDAQRVGTMARQFWPAVQLPGGSKSSRLVIRGVLRAHMHAARTWLNPLNVTARDLAARHDAQERPWSLAQWMASHEADRLDLKDWLDVLAPLCMPHPDVL